MPLLFAYVALLLLPLSLYSSGFHRDQLHDLRPCDDSIKGIGGASQRCVEMGDLSFSALDENGGKVTVELSDVRLAPDVDIALISASQLIGAGFEVILGTPPRLKDPFGTNLPLRTSNGLYLIDGQALASWLPHGRATPESRITHAAASDARATLTLPHTSPR